MYQEKFLTIADCLPLIQTFPNQKNWELELEKNLPTKIKVFRQAILKSPRINELFDPWYMDNNTRDDVAPKPNAQVDGNEKLHATHLHITVIEPQIL